MQHLHFPSSVIITLLLIIFILTAILHFFEIKRPVVFLLLCLFYGIGFFHAQIQSFPPADKNHIWNIIIDKQEGVIVGTLISMPEYNGRTSKVTVSTKYLRLKSQDQFTPVTGDILFRMKGPWPNHLLPGDTLVLRAALKRPTSFNSPGSFDFSQYLARQDIWITGFIQAPLFIKKLAGNNSFFHNLRFYPEKIRAAIGKEIDIQVSSEMGGLYRAILLGDRSGISETVSDQFKATGVMHILAIIYTKQQ